MKPVCATLLLLLPAVALLAGACGTYRQDYSYEPAPAVSAQAAPRLLAAVYGVLRGDDETPAGIDLRVRLEAGDVTAEIRPEDLALVTADLVPLELVRVEPQGGMIAPSGGAATWRTIWAFPPGRGVGDLDLTGLVFTWHFRAGAESMAATSHFKKTVEPIWWSPYDGPWWHGTWGYGYGGWYRW